MKYLITALLFSLSLQAQGFINWQPPVVKAQKPSQNHGGHGGRKAKQLQINNFDHDATTETYYLMPTLERRELTAEHGIISLPKTGMENYHALVATQTKEKRISSSIRYIYSRGRPSKVSPTRITQIQKSELEIAPILLPREHDEYKGSKSYGFELHFKGEVLPNTTVTLTTSNGSEETFKTDKDGEFKITIPNDFKDVKTGRRANKPSEFILKASYLDQDINYMTTLAMPYHVNPVDYWNNRIMGLIVLVIGLIVGLFLFRNINKKKKRKV